jgi:polyisoprenoid-binding protein YceI
MGPLTPLLADAASAGRSGGAARPGGDTQHNVSRVGGASPRASGYPHLVKSPLAPVVLPVAAVIGALARWWLQGTHGLYTATHKRFYIADPDLGWREAAAHPVWLGLEICAVIVAIAVGLAVAGWLIRRREAKRGARATLLRIATWVVAAVPLVVPVAAFASGGAPAGAVEQLPEATLRGIEAGITGIIDAPAGRYEVVAHAGTVVTAKLSAGHDTFDGRFADHITGSWQGDPRDLTQPMTAEIKVATAAIDTGIDERSKHAREAYLHADKFPEITVAIDRVLAAKQAKANAVEFRAHGTLGLAGKTHEVEITGTLRRPDAAALGRLGLTGDVLLVQAAFSVVIKETVLAADASDFDGDRIPIQVSLVLRHTSGETAAHGAPR